MCEKEMKTKAYSKEGLQQAMTHAKDEDPNTENKKWYPSIPQSGIKAFMGSSCSEVCWVAERAGNTFDSTVILHIQDRKGTCCSSFSD